MACQYTSLIALLISITQWHSNLVWQPMVQLFLAVLLIAFSLRYFSEQQFTGDFDVVRQERRVSLSSSEFGECDISAKSKTTAWVLFFVLRDRSSHKLRHLLIFRDAVCESDYRILCRAIMFARKHERV